MIGNTASVDSPSDDPKVRSRTAPTTLTVGASYFRYIRLPPSIDPPLRVIPTPTISGGQRTAQEAWTFLRICLPCPVSAARDVVRPRAAVAVG
jgi:hypothetical protein